VKMNDDDIDKMYRLGHWEYDTIRYDSVYLTCSKKLMGSQRLVHHTEQTKN